MLCNVIKKITEQNFIHEMNPAIHYVCICVVYRYIHTYIYMSISIYLGVYVSIDREEIRRTTCAKIFSNYTLAEGLWITLIFLLC